MTDRWAERLSEYLDHTLDGRERAECARHLEGCAECRAILADLGAVVMRARAVVDPTPAVDLWPSIARRLDAEPRREGWSRLVGTGFRFTIPQLAGAALALIVLSGGTVWLALERPWHPASTQGPTRLAPLAAASGAPASGLGPAPSSTVNAQPATFDAARYDAAVADLERVLRDNRADLDTSTVRVIEQNLATIDRAILDARRALAADPSSPYLNGHLVQQLQAKVRLLQRATDAIAANSS